MKRNASGRPIKKITTVCAVVCAAVLILAFGIFLWDKNRPDNLDYGYAREVPENEMALRQKLIGNAEAWLGTVKGSPEHRRLIDLYNSQEVLPVGYTVTYNDNWCAAFVTAVAIQSGIEDIIPPECGCQRQIALFESMGRWQEDETYVPLPGDVIYYSRKGALVGDNTGWSDHVGIVVGTSGDYIKVIEGNNRSSVRYRYVRKDNSTIRGYGLPDYSGKCN